MVALIILFLPLCNANNIKLSDEFTFCSINNHNMEPVDLDQNCKSKTNFKVHDSKRKANILIKLHDRINGEAFQCKIEILHRQTEETIFFSKYQSTRTENVKVTAEECKYMVETKICRGNKMNCNGNTCKFHGEPLEEFSYGRTRHFQNFSCSIVPRYLKAESEKSHLFGKLCTVNDEQCNLDDSILIWDKNKVLHACPFKVITTETVYLTSKSEYINYKYSWLFNLKQTKTI